MLGVGRDLCGSSSPAPLLKQGQLSTVLSSSQAAYSPPWFCGAGGNGRVSAQFTACLAPGPQGSW